MQKVIVEAFGSAEQLQVLERPDPIAQGNQVVVKLTSIGMNHADLMARRGEYKLISGNPPFTPGLEGGGYIQAVGEAVVNRHVGQRVILSLDAVQRDSANEGTYQSHYLTIAEHTIPAPDAIPDTWLGAIWLPYITAWGCLVFKQGLQPGQVVLLPAASSSVAIAASQVVKHHGGIPIGTTTSPAKVDKLRQLAAAQYSHVVVTQNSNWWQEVKQLTGGKGPDIIFDPVAAGEFLNTEIRLLANGGTLWIYGLLGKPGVVNVTPLIRKSATIRGWMFNELIPLEPQILQTGYQHVLECLAQGIYELPIAATFPLQAVQQAHQVMEQGQHIGKFVLVP